MQNADGFVICLDRETSGARKSHSDDPIVPTELLVTHIVLKIFKYKALAGLKNVAAKAFGEFSALQRAHCFFSQAAAGLKPQFAFLFVEHMDPTGIEMERLDHLFNGLMQDDLKIQRLADRGTDRVQHGELLRSSFRLTEQAGFFYGDSKMLGHRLEEPSFFGREFPWCLGIKKYSSDHARFGLDRKDGEEPHFCPFGRFGRA